MKKSKLIISSAVLTPIAIAPAFLTTSCSVYTDIMNNFHPSFEQYSAKQSLTEAEARAEWFNFFNDSNKLRDEILGSFNIISKKIWTLWYLEENVKAEITIKSLLIHFNYANIDKDTHKISFSYKGECDTHVDYIFVNGDSNSEKVATANQHYTFDINLKNLVYNLYWDSDIVYKEDPLWVLYPVVFWENPETWTTLLVGDEEISFNNRYISEVYNMKNQQHYSIQTTEGGIISESSPLTVDLSWLINKLVVVASYYLNKTQHTA